VSSSTTREIILVHRSPGVRDGGDPAINLDAPGIASALSDYQRTRSAEALAAIPLKPGMQPARFIIRRITQGELRFVRDGRSPVEQAQRAFLAGCHAYTDAAGREHRAKVTTEGAVSYAGDEWLDAVGDEYGGDAISEIGHAVIQWASASRAALAPFASVPGLVLAR
jgi:hypothetical protein